MKLKIDNRQLEVFADDKIYLQEKPAENSVKPEQQDKDSFKKVEKVAIIGAGGRTGKALIEFFGDKGLPLVLFDSRKAQIIEENFNQLLQYRDLYSWGESKEEILAADLVIPSPGVPPDNELMQLAQQNNLTIISELELAYHFCPGQIIAITGTNGKTTISRLLAQMLQRGLKEQVILAGNIGKPAIAVVEELSSKGWLVLEVSSFQLDGCQAFRPDIAVFSNFFPDHLDWHGNKADYQAAKGKIFSSQTEKDLAVINGDDEIVRELALASQAQVKKVSHNKAVNPTALLNENIKIRNTGDGNSYSLDLKTQEIVLKGQHNKLNLALAAVVALELGVSGTVVKEVGANFTADPHRLEIFIKQDHQLLVDDSKATNPAAAIEALKTFSAVDNNLVLIAGGQDRGQDNKSFARAISKYAETVILLGETAPELALELKNLSYDNLIRVDTIKDAAVQGLKILNTEEDSQVLLLSPGAPSWDMFSSYKERGKLFKESCREIWFK